jgi:hypothetical protein
MLAAIPELGPLIARRYQATRRFGVLVILERVEAPEPRAAQGR